MSTAELSLAVSNHALEAFVALGLPDARHRSAVAAETFCKEIASWTGDCTVMRLANVWAIRAGRAEQEGS